MNHAIIGCGRVAPNHILGFKYSKKSVLVCCDLNEEKARNFASDYKIPFYVTDWHQVIERDDVDSISICTDHGSHAQIAIEALKAGKNVLVEKPMALNVKDAELMIEESRKNSKVLAVVSQHRYNPIAGKIKELIDNKIFGKITMVNGLLNSFKDQEYYKDSGWRGTLLKEGGSTLINQAIHTLDLIIWMNGNPFDFHTIKDNFKFKGLIETEDTLASIFRLENNSIGSISSTNTSIKFWDSRIEIIGLNGSITFKTGFPFEVTDLVLENEIMLRKVKTDLDNLKYDNKELPPTQTYYDISHKYQIDNFVKSIKGEEILKMDPSEGLKTLKSVLEIYKSARR